MNFLVVDDHGIFRSGLQVILTGIYSDATVLEASCAADALQRINDDSNLELVFIDLQLPDSSGLDLLVEIQKQHAALPCVIISADQRASMVRQALDAGALGYIPKSANNAVITSAIQLIMSGGVYAPHELMSNAPAASVTAAQTNLTSRQLEVLRLIAEGLANKQICNRLQIAPGTTKAHISAIFNELNVTNRTQAVACAQELGLI